MKYLRAVTNTTAVEWKTIDPRNIGDPSVPHILKNPPANRVTEQSTRNGSLRTRWLRKGEKKPDWAV